MSITASDIVNRAKLIWRDASANFATQPYSWLSDGILELRSLRPESTRFDSEMNHIDFEEVDDGADVINMDVRFRPCLVDYLVSRGFDENARHDEAGKFYQLFVAKAKAA